jgi:hypothetical protein
VNMLTLTIACPEAHISDGNQFSRCVGLGPDDDKTFGLALWQDALGNLYAVASGLVGDSFTETATSPLVGPAWGCDMDAAERAQALIRMPDPETGELVATPDTIAAAYGTDVMGVIAGMGLTQVQEEGLD